MKVGTQTFSTNVYENDRNGLLSEVQYGNGGKVGYNYDEFDRLTGVKYDGEANARYEYKYGANGMVAEVEDRNLGRFARTDYDQADRPCQTELRDSTTGEALYKTGLKYNKLNQLEMFSEKAGSESHKSEYAYDRDNRVTGITYDGGSHKVNYTYDELGRAATRVAECGADSGKLTSTYEYVDGGYGTKSTTPLVKKITQNGISFEYTYDTRGNIISEKRNGEETTYAYDALGQLIRVNDPHENATWVYNYDRGGNITSKVQYAYVTTDTLGTPVDTISYAYGDSNWKDKLTSYDGKGITYDAIGNPTSDGMWDYEWQAGRQLKRMSREGQALTFKYDHNGMRVQKVLEHSWYPETTNYTYHGKLLAHMTVDYYDWDEVAQHDKLHFFYDAQSRPAKVSYNGVIYTYIHNLQGDIVGLLDSAGTLVVEYKYDAWGKLLGTTGTLADTLGKRNPFRYRGYVYDEETGLYYLRSRYYASEEGRFINSDIIISSSPRILTSNVFAYCANNPTIHLDRNGKLFEAIGKWLEEFLTPSNIFNTIMGGLGVEFNALINSVGKAIQNAPRPNNIGAGIYAKKIASELSGLRKFGKVGSAIINCASYIGAAIDVVSGIINNVRTNESFQVIASDAIVDATISAGSIYVAGKAGAAIGAKIGTIVGPGVGSIIGAGAGYLIGVGLYWVTDMWEIGGKTIREHVKDWFRSWW